MEKIYHDIVIVIYELAVVTLLFGVAYLVKNHTHKKDK